MTLDPGVEDWMGALADNALELTIAAGRSPYNHTSHHGGCTGCAQQLPLTLADRERIHGRPYRRHDQTGDYHDVFCARCLAPLPHGFTALFHVCEDETRSQPMTEGDT